MEENAQHVQHTLLYYFKKGKMKLKCKRFVRCVSDQTCQKWFPKFCAGYFSLGRPVEIDSNQIKTLIENNQYYTMWEIADIL